MVSWTSLVLDALDRVGGPGRTVASRLDLMRSIGVGYAVGEHRQRRASRQLPSDGRRPGYVERWCEAARELGAEAADLSGGFVEVRRGGTRVVVWNHWVPLDDVVTLQLTLDKPLVHRILAGAGVPVPEYARFDAGDLTPALEFLARADGPCVVKPMDRQGGMVITSSIFTPVQLRRARLRARRLSRRLMIERQVAGDNYRLLFLDGELLDVVRRDPPRVIGDGRSSVRELLVAENERRSVAAGGVRTWELVADLDAVFTLERRGLTLGSVPGAGESVVVKTVINVNGPEFNESVRDQVSDAFVADAARAVSLLGVRLAGVDVISPDCRRSLAAAGGVILEVNATPGLHYHYDIRNPDQGVPVFTCVLRALLSDGASDQPLQATVVGDTP